MRRSAVTIAFVAATGCLFFQGCAPTVRDFETGAEARYEWETLRSELDEPIATIYAAARDAARELDLRTLRCDLDGIAAEVIALDAHLETVYIRLEALPESRSLLTIRVGMFGSRNKSIVLFSEIMAQVAGRETAVSRDAYYDD